MSRWDDAGSAASARAEARAERFVAREPRASAYERPDREISVRERPERPDLLGIRLRDREPTLAERYGVSLIDREQAEHIERLKRDADAMIERWSSRDWQRERQDRPLAGSLPTAPSPYSFSIGPVLGLGPAVAPDGNSGSVPLIWSIPTIVPSPVPTVEIQIGVTKGLTENWKRLFRATSVIADRWESGGFQSGSAIISTDRATGAFTFKRECWE